MIYESSGVVKYIIYRYKAPAAAEQLAGQLLEIEAAGDRACVDAWFAKYAVMPDHFTEALEKVAGIPVDIEPIFFPRR
jgi:hypothetical protein